MAAVRIAKTPLGDETLALADDDCLVRRSGMQPAPSDVIVGPGEPDRRISEDGRSWTI